MLFAIELFRNSAINEREVYRINVWIENHMIEMPDNNRERRQDRFIEVNRKGNINPPTREKSEHANLEPNHQARQAHDECAPDHGPIFSLFGISKARDLRLHAIESEVIGEV